MTGNFWVANSHEKSDKTPRINLRGLNFVCNPVYKCEAEPTIRFVAIDTRYRDVISLSSTSLLTSVKTFGEIAWARVSLGLKVPLAG